MDERLGIGGNRPPIAAPAEEDMLADLVARFPELETEIAQFEKDAATYPKKLTLADEDVAKAMQDLLGKVKKHLSKLKAYKKDEKAPWDRVAKVVQNFFTTREEKVSALKEGLEGTYEDYLQQKRDDAARRAEEEAQRRRAEAEAAERARAEAEQRAREAAEREAAARQAEEAARRRAQEEEERRKAAEERRKAAEEEEKRLAEARKQRDREERDRNADNLRQVRAHMKRARALHEELQAAEEGAQDGDTMATAELDGLVRPGGPIGALLGPIADSNLLDDEQRALVEEFRQEIGRMRHGALARFDAKEKRRRAKEAKEEEAREAAAAAARRAEREEQERRETAAREAREREEAEAREAKERERAREAAGDAREAYADQKDAVRDQKAQTNAADRAANAADRIERRLENSTDADLSRTRGDLGTVGGLRRSWKHYLPDDETALRAVLGPLGPHFTTEALSGAVFHWMRAHQAGFTSERVEPSELPGVVFAYETDAQIR